MKQFPRAQPQDQQQTELMKAAIEKAIHDDTLTQLNSALASQSQGSATQTHAEPSSLAACIEGE